MSLQRRQERVVRHLLISHGVVPDRFRILGPWVFHDECHRQERRETWQSLVDELVAFGDRVWRKLRG